MSIPQDKIVDLRVRQLEMLQTNIARIAGYGATIKNWCITVTTAVCGFGIQIKTPGVVLLALLPVITFAFLDAQYLRVERQIRSTFDRVRRENWDTAPSFDAGPGTASEIPLVTVFCSWSIVGFYMPLALGVAIVMLAEYSYYGSLPTH
jgi:hypothetical protein